MSTSNTTLQLLPVMEIFGPTIQGEGMLAGQRSHFVRFGGCGYRCNWCDSMHAVDPVLVKRNRELMQPSYIIDVLLGFNASRWVTLSGGDPCMHDLGDLIKGLQHREFQVAIETQGQLWPKWMQDMLPDLVTFSPKPPSSGMADKFNGDAFCDIVADRFGLYNVGKLTCIKVPCFDHDDVEWARQIHQMLPEVPFYITPGTPVHGPLCDSREEIIMDVCDSYKQIVEYALKIGDMHDVIIIPQLHTLMWGHEKGK